MFEHSGKKIQTYAKVIFILEIVGVLLGLLAATIAGLLADWWLGVAIFFSGIVLGGLMLLGTYILALFIYAFGDIAEETKKQSAGVEETNRLLGILTGNTDGVPEDAAAGTRR